MGTITKFKVGNEAARIIKYLNTTGPNEPNKIAKACSMRLDQTHKTLYQMIKENTIKILNEPSFDQKYFNLSKLICFYKFNSDIYKYKIRDDLFDTVINLLSALQHHLFQRNRKLNEKSHEFKLENLEIFFHNEKNN